VFWALIALGGGHNAGYGHVEVQGYELLRRRVERRGERNDNSFKIVKTLHEVPIADELDQADQEWQKYVACAGRAN
jgi:hypothetical protein